MSQATELPRWMDVALLPAVNLAIALLVAGGVVLLVGFKPDQVLTLLVKGAFGSKAGISYTLYYATTFVFTGLAVAVAFHGGLFNIGGEGQAIMGGLGAGLVALALSAHLPAWVMLPLMVLGAALFGLVWAAVPGVLQAWRGSHTVITTIMFNFIAASLVGYLINYWFRPVGKMAVESREITGAYIMSFREVAREFFGVRLASSPLNFSVFLAIAAAVAVWYLLWRTKLGYEIRALGANSSAAVYAGIKPGRIIVITMAISGALAGLMAVNEILGVQHRLLLGFVGGAGFVGIAVALMGRSHPVGIVLAAMLFGLLYQGGSELSFAKPDINRDMVVVIQGLVILFMGALEYAFRPWVAALFFRAEEA